MNLVTFVIPVAPPHKALLADALESVQHQTIPCQVIVIDDKQQQGPGWARNKGLRQVQTPFVVFLDADDVVAPNFAESCLRVWRPYTYVWTHWYEDGLIRPLPGESKPVTHLVTTLMATDLARAVGGFDEHTESEDTDFYLKLMVRDVKGIRLAEPLVYYSNSGQRARDFHSSGQFVKTMQRLADKHGLILDLPELAPVEDIQELADLLFDRPVAERPAWVKWRPPAPEKIRKLHHRPPLPDNPIVSIVAPTCNRNPYLQNMVKSVRRTCNLPYEIVIVDGGSTDGALQWAKAQWDIRLIEHGALFGTVRAFTDGAKAARGKYVILCNDDTEFVEGAIEKAHAWLEARKTCGAVAFAYDMPQHPGKFVVGKHTFPQANGQVIERNFCNMGMYRKALGDQIGWCGADDPAFKARSYGSDSYVSERVWEAGYTIDAVLGAIVHDRNAHDELKKINQWPPSMSNPDTRAFYARFPQGAEVPLRPVPCSE